jgi:hypothetical protein
VLFYGIIMSMYAGGFATIPAYLKDIFGVRYVGAIHGRLLRAWSAGSRLETMPWSPTGFGTSAQ